MRLPIAALCLVLAGPTAAQAPLPAQVESIGLIPGWRTSEGVHVAAVEIRLAKGWHTYWRAPGGNGIPPQFDWSASANLAAVAYDWPRPIVFDTYGSPTIGYKGALVLPLRLTATTPDAPIDVDLDLFFGVCDDICIPAEARITARLDAEAAPQGRAEIEAALAAKPLDPRAGGVASVRCGLAPEGGGHVVTAEITLDATPRADLTAVIEAETRPDLWIGAAQTRTAGRTVHATARLDPMTAGGPAVERSALRVTLLDPTQAIDIPGCSGRD